jgi:hypothetical protein
VRAYWPLEPETSRATASLPKLVGFPVHGFASPSRHVYPRTPETYTILRDGRSSARAGELSSDRSRGLGSARRWLARMRVELDHLFVCTAPGAPEAEELIRFGLREGPPNQHP